MPNDNGNDPWRLWRGWSPSQEIAHPDAPAGGAGPGSFDTAAHVGHEAPPPGVPHPDSPAGKSIDTFTLRDGMSRQQVKQLLGRVEHAPFSQLPSSLEVEIGQATFGLGAATGIAKGLGSMVVGTVDLAIALQKVGRTLILADFCDRMTAPRDQSWWFGPMRSLILILELPTVAIYRNELNEAVARREALKKELEEVFQHKEEILKNVPAKVRDEYVKKWNRLLNLNWKTHSGSLVNYPSAFEAGEIFGEVLVEVVSMIYAVRGVVKLATEIPELWALATKGEAAGAVAGAADEGLESAGGSGSDGRATGPPRALSEPGNTGSVSSNSSIVPPLPTKPGTAAANPTASVLAVPPPKASTSLDKNKLAQELIDMKGSADKKDVDLVAAQLTKLPTEALQKLKDNKTRVVVCRGSMTEYRTDLKGVKPRGWPPGSTWDKVPGAYNPDRNEVVVATVGHGTKAGAHVPVPGEGHGSANLVLHETAHALDHATAGSSGKTFLSARTKDAEHLSAYESQLGRAGQEETYAESAARYYSGDSGAVKKYPALTKYWQSNPFNGGGKKP